MKKRENFRSKLKRIGDSDYILVNKNIKTNLNLVSGDMVDVQIYKSDDNNSKILEIRCLKCEHIFYDDDKEVYDCPNCGFEFTKSQAIILATDTTGKVLKKTKE